MTTNSARPGFSLVELTLFLGLLGMTAGVVIALLVSTNENRVRQQSITTVEQTGVQLMQTLTRRIRAAERVLDPPIGEMGSVLALQMAQETEDPTVIGVQSGVIVVARNQTTQTLTSSRVTVLDLRVRNTSESAAQPSVLVSFTIEHVVPVITKGTYRRRFEVLVAPFPDDAPDGSACVCPGPECSASGTYVWKTCDANDECMDGPIALACEMFDVQEPEPPPSPPPSSPTDFAGRWGMNEGTGTQTTDASGAGYNGTLVNMTSAAWVTTTAPLLAANPFALDFDRNNDYVNINATPALNSYGKTALTVSAWIRPDGGGEENEGRIVDKSGNTSLNTSQGYTLTLYNAGPSGAALAGSVRHESVSALTISAANAVTYGAWHHVAFVFNATGNKKIDLYLDGALLTPASQVAGSGLMGDDRSTPMHIGGYSWGTVRTFDGIIDDVRVYGRALNAAEIGALAAGG